MILPIIKHPNELLTQRCEVVKRINKDLVQLGKDLIETMKDQNGLGLAAPQVGQLVRVLAMMHGKKPTVMYNPSIVSQSMTRRGFKESCLSFEAGEEYLVKRPIEVKVKFQDATNKQKFLYLKGLDATVFFHEYDHILGVTMDVNGTKVIEEKK